MTFPTPTVARKPHAPYNSAAKLRNCVWSGGLGVLKFYLINNKQGIAIKALIILEFNLIIIKSNINKSIKEELVTILD